MSRRLFTLCSALSLVLFLSVCGLWVRSHLVGDALTWLVVRQRSGVCDLRHYQLFSGRGAVVVIVSRSTSLASEAGSAANLPEGTEFRWDQAPRGNPSSNLFARSFWNRRGFVHNTFWLPHGPTANFGFGGRVIAAPYWLPALLLSVLPAAWGLKAIRARVRSRRGHCPRCGYDLRASPGRCPECGEAAGAAAGR